MQTSYRNFGGAFPKTASTAFKVGDFVSFVSGTGNIIPGPGSMGNILGVCLEEVSATSTTNDMIGVTVANDIVSFKATVTGGTVSTTDAGSTIDVSTADASVLDAATLGTGVDFEILAVLNDTTVIVKAR